MKCSNYECPDEEDAHCTKFPAGCEHALIPESEQPTSAPVDSPSAGSVLDSALKETGFEICHYGPSEDKCEKCEKPHKQHFYRRTCYEVEEGEYWCAECVIQERKDLHDPNGPYSMPSPNND